MCNVVRRTFFRPCLQQGNGDYVPFSAARVQLESTFFNRHSVTWTASNSATSSEALAVQTIRPNCLHLSTADTMRQPIETSAQVTSGEKKRQVVRL